VARREKSHREDETERTRHPRMLGTRGVAVVAELKTSCDELSVRDGLAVSVETDGLPLRAVAAEGKRDGVGPCRIVRMDRADADSEKCRIE